MRSRISEKSANQARNFEPAINFIASSVLNRALPSIAKPCVFCEMNLSGKATYRNLGAQALVIGHCCGNYFGVDVARILGAGGFATSPERIDWSTCLRYSCGMLRM